MSIASMTGFGAGTARDQAEEVVVELRSVNGKFCEVKPRLPRELSGLEADLVREVKARLARGNVDVTVRRSVALGATTVPRVNAALVAEYARSLAEAAQSAGIPGEIGIRDLLSLDGVVTLEERPPDLESAGRALSQALSTALERLVEVRGREGAALEADLRARLGTLRQLAAQVATLAPATVEQYRERLRQRVRDLGEGVTLDPGRLEQEVVLFADRTDVAEELTRLSAHFDEFDRLLERTGPVGRQLDFLIQEINREVNTTGSKSQSTDVARHVVEMKAEIERLREQVQNVE